MLHADEQRDIVTDTAESPRMWRAAEMGELLRLTKAERERVGIKTFRAAGVTRRQMTADNKARDRERKRKARAKARLGRPPSLAKLKPWLDLGISERTYFRRKKAAADGIKNVRNTCSHICRTGSVPR
ncbi:hypothetical protein GIW81_06205 [Hyphomicrobium sp. xq]|uniref:Uncharacterized protein n=1 Tax=Hyphomicrobium album TaxID=2665159 RepID=A0A6I3KJJ7_9HYPH|nr:hypothetical protein [Hyphomicrobium album]MTD93927.1 hypothetical protein [Hyphomicrobium album]